jgi:hypothetical protein
MNELIEEIRDWVSESLTGKIVGFVLLFYSVNTILWGLAEPISISYKFWCNYPIFHYVTVFVLSAIGMYFILRKKIIKTINFESLKSNGQDNWTTVEGKPERTIESDNVLGKYISFKGGHDDQSKFTLDGVSSTGTILNMIYNPKEQFILYAHFRLNPKKEGNSQDGWFALYYNIKTPYKESDHEWGYPIKFRVIENKWLASRVNLKSAVKKTFGKSSWEYSNLIGIKIRGTGSLQEISVS